MDKKEKPPNILYFLALVTQLGLVMISSIIIGMMLGLVADKFLGISPWGTALGILIGIAAGFYAVYQLIMKNLRKLGP